MPGKRRLFVATLVMALVMVGVTNGVADAQESQDRLAFSNGNGILRVGDQRFKITSVVVKLVQDRKAEITLVSDISIFLIATWSNHTESKQEYDLEISGSESRAGLDGIGKVVLSADGKAVARLSLKGVSRATKRPVEATFEGK